MKIRGYNNNEFYIHIDKLRNIYILEIFYYVIDYIYNTKMQNCKYSKIYIKLANLVEKYI